MLYGNSIKKDEFNSKFAPYLHVSIQALFNDIIQCQKANGFPMSNVHIFDNGEFIGWIAGNYKDEVIERLRKEMLVKA